MNYLMLAILVTIWAQPSWATPRDLEVNLREQCRRAVSGEYLKFYDGWKRSNALVINIRGQLSELDKRLASSRKEYQKLKGEAAVKTFDIKLASKRDQVGEAVKALEQQQKNFRELIDQNGSVAAKFKRDEENLLKQLHPVFDKVVIKPRDKNTGYPFVFQYKHECPKYRRLCQLPDQMADALIKIKIEGQNPESCSRYASYSKIR